jgi:hypothetical protein
MHGVLLADRFHATIALGIGGVPIQDVQFRSRR